MKQQIYTTTDIGKILGCSSRTAVKLIDTAKIIGYRLGKDRRVHHDYLVQYLKSQPGLLPILERLT